MLDFSNIILPIVQKAGKIMLDSRKVESEGGVSEKYGDPANLVTKYDLAIQEFLITEIKKVFPEACFIAEEKENDSNVLTAEYCFVIDPIDGTSNFIHEYSHSCISLALISKNELVFAVVYDPYLDEIFHAQAGQGAFLNGQAMHVSDRDVAHSILLFGTSPYRKEFSEKTFDTVREIFLDCSDVRRSGSAALDLAYLAAGKVDMFFELMLSPWDIAAGLLLVREAGGIITDANGNEITLSSPCSVIGANSKTYAYLLEKIK